MSNKGFTTEQIQIVILITVAIVTFIGTNSPMWSGEFWKEFVLHFIVYVAVVETVFIMLSDVLFKE